MTGLQRFPYARPRTEPCHPYRCEICGYTLRLETVNGRVIEVCLGCIRNQDRAAMQLPVLNFLPPAHAPATRARSIGPLTQRILSKIPRAPAFAVRPKQLATACGTTQQVVLRVLKRAEAEGRVQAVPGGNRSHRKWYRRAA